MNDYDEMELELQHDEKFGELLRVEIIDVNQKQPVILAKIRRRDVNYLCVHRGYIKGQQLFYGKGISLSLEEEECELVSLGIQQIIGEDSVWDDD